MPYGPRDTPEGAKNYSPHGQKVFKAAFNACHKSLGKGESEAKCFRIAHSAAQKSGKKQ